MIGWLGNICIVLGLWGIGSKRRSAFLFSVVGEAAYIWRSYATHDWALFAVCCVFLAMAIRGFYLWGNEAKRFLLNPIVTTRRVGGVTLTFNSDTTDRKQPAKDWTYHEFYLDPVDLHQLAVEAREVDNKRALDDAIAAAGAGRRR
jgi:hypothetical protein